MDVGLQRMVSGATTSKSSDRPNNSSPLLCPASSDYAKKLENESLTLMQEKYPSLVDIDAVDVLKVIGSMQNFLMRNTQQGLTELCVSIAFPLVILQCRTLTTLLASLSSLEEDGGLGSNYLDPKYSCVLTRLEECFDWRLESVWNRVFSHWKSKAKDGDWIDRRTKDLIVNLAEISPMLLSVEDAFTQIDQIAGTTLFQITRNAERTFHMFDTGISECTAKAQELRIEQGTYHRYLTIICPVADRGKRRQNTFPQLSIPPLGLNHGPVAPVRHQAASSRGLHLEEVTRVPKILQNQIRSETPREDGADHTRKSMSLPSELRITRPDFLI
ncbi:unnamed protein product [Fusarium graminearum]|nr:unnamed protein product [Fusarium graminearum]